MNTNSERVSQAGEGSVVRLTYHEIVEKGDDYRYSVSAERFREHVAEIATARGLLRSSRIELSFDDGHASHRELAMPILNEYGLIATFFVTAGWTGSRSGYMTNRQIRELSQAGHSVQSHGWSHRMLTLCTDKELHEELSQSRMAIENITGEPVQALSAPNGRWNRRVLEAAVNAGYRFIYTSDPLGKDKIVPPLQVLGRLMVTRNIDTTGLHRLCCPPFSTRVLQHVSHSSKQMLRLALGEQRYHSLWCKLAKREGEW